MKKYFYFAVQRQKLVSDSTGRTRNVRVLVYGTKTFSNEADCLKEYWPYIVKHSNMLFGVFGYEKPLDIDPVTHECKGFKAE